MFSKKTICAGSYSFNGMRIRGVLSTASYRHPRRGWVKSPEGTATGSRTIPLIGVESEQRGLGGV